VGSLLSRAQKLGALRLYAVRQAIREEAKIERTSEETQTLWYERDTLRDGHGRGKRRSGTASHRERDTRASCGKL